MFKRLNIKGIVFVLATLSLPVSATTLADALVLAYQTNPQIIAQQAFLRATDESVISARANLLPVLKQTLQACGEQGQAPLPRGLVVHDQWVAWRHQCQPQPQVFSLTEALVGQG